MTEDKRKLSDAEIVQALSTLDGWKRDGKFLAKDFVFANFREINAFLPYLTDTIVDQNHHPDFSFESGKKLVAIRMTTHSEGGITQADIDLATALNSWPR